MTTRDMAEPNWDGLASQREYATIVVAPTHPKVMPVILTTAEEIDLWLEGETIEALKLQRPLPDDALKIVARGEKEDPAAKAERSE